MRYAVEVAEVGSVNKAAENLLIAPPNISRSIKELEADLGITIFDRTARGMDLTAVGEEFITYAKGILQQINQVEAMYRTGSPKKQKFSISVPRACYVAEAFVRFTNALTEDPAEIFYEETNSQRTINNILNANYKLGIIRYAENYDKYFKATLEEKDLGYEVVTEFTYRLLMSKENPLAQKEQITFQDLQGYIEVAHADPYVPSLPVSKVMKEELPNNIDRRIFIFERASQYDLLANNPHTFMWVSPVPEKVQQRYGLVERFCEENQKVYCDMLIYRNGYTLTRLDRQFIESLREVKTKYL